MVLLAGFQALLARLTGQRGRHRRLAGRQPQPGGDRAADRVLRQHPGAARRPGAAIPRSASCSPGCARPPWRPTPTRTSPSSNWWRSCKPERRRGGEPALPGPVRGAERADGRHGAPRPVARPAGDRRPGGEARSRGELLGPRGRAGGGSHLQHRALRPHDRAAPRRAPGDPPARPGGGPRPPGLGGAAARRGGAPPAPGRMELRAGRAGGRPERPAPPLRGPGGPRARGPGGLVGGRTAHLRRARPPGQPDRPPPSGVRSAAGGSRRPPAGTLGGDGRRHPGRAQDGRRLRADRSRLSRRARSTSSCGTAAPRSCSPRRT